jgi:putative endopeptidase
LPIIAAVLLGQAGCKRASEPENAAAPSAAPAWRLDEKKLSAPIRFGVADLDPAKGACTDFAGYANAKWLAANPIPGDKSSWGAFDVLELRSLGIQRQLAEHSAGKATPTGIEKIVADFWGSGMDEARVNAQGLTPLKDRLAAIDALSDGPSVADYLRKVAADGENPLFAFFPLADFKNSSMNLAYAMQGGLGLPECWNSRAFGQIKRRPKPRPCSHSRRVSPVLQNRPKTWRGMSRSITTRQRRPPQTS